MPLVCRLRVAVAQFDSKLKQVSQNIATAERLLRGVRSDLVVLPELALTGYNYESREEIVPCIDQRSLDWAREYASNNHTHVVLGYPELVGSRIYNSAALVGRDGQVLANYHKTHLYTTDVGWGACRGEFVAYGPFPTLPIRIQLGICMDLNPNEFTAPWEAFEFARSCKANNAQLAIVPCAWQQSESDQQLVEYWCARQPYMIPTIFANRCGRERGTTFGGASTIRMLDGKTRSLGSGEGVLEVDLDVPRS